MKQFKIITFSIIIYSSATYATPNFAREYSVDCTTCHTMIPTLNLTGKNFLRNGFRFSKNDTPTLKKIISPQESDNRPIPLAVMLNSNYDNQDKEWHEKVKFYTGGTISKNISFFGLTKDTFNSNKDDSQEFFTQSSSRAYLQFNFAEDKHVSRIGIISPLTQFGNIIKISADSGLKGNNGIESQDNKNDNGKENHSIQERNENIKGNKKGKEDEKGNSSNEKVEGNQHYKTPLQNASIENIKGIEYSYLFSKNIMFLFSYGEQVKENGNDKSLIEDEDNYQITGGVKYNYYNGYSISFIYNKFKKNGIENESFLIPIEKEFDKVHLLSTLIYKDTTDNEEEYYGIENTIIYPFSNGDYIRGVINLDRQDGDSNYGFSLTYSKVYKNALFHLTGARKVTPNDNENILLGSFSLLF